MMKSHKYSNLGTRSYADFPNDFDGFGGGGRMTGPACENVRSFDSNLGIGVAREEGFGDPAQNDYDTMHPDRSNPATMNLNLNDQLVGAQGHPDHPDDGTYHGSRSSSYDPDALF